MTTTAPGWYPDPHDRSKTRYWDGQAWSDQTQDLQAQPPASPPVGQASTNPRSGKRPPLLPIGLGLLALLVIGVSAAFLLTRGGDDSSGGEVIAAGSTAEEESTAPEEESTIPEEDSEGSSATSGESSSDSSSSSQASPSASIDGLPDDARRCGAGVYARRGTTSCPFARNVRRDYASAESDSFDSFSPTTGGTFTMSCSGTAPVVCTGGNDAAVYIP